MHKKNTVKEIYSMNKETNETPVHTLTICMGSSCFSRGNGRNYETIKQYIDEHNLSVNVKIKGCRCGNMCMKGPNIWIDGRLFSDVDQGSIIDIMKASF